MSKPEKLFEGGPEWEEGFNHWYVKTAGVRCEIRDHGEATGWSAKVVGFDTERTGRESIDQKHALAWLRSRIIAHRDELIRVTGAG